MAKFALVTRYTYFNEDDQLYDTEEEARAAATEMLKNDPTKPVRIDRVVATLVGTVSVTEMDDSNDSSSDSAQSGDDGASETKAGTKKA